MNEINAFIKETPEGFLARFLPCEDTRSLQPGMRSHPTWHHDLELPASRTVENKSLLFISQSVAFCYSGTYRLRKTCVSTHLILKGNVISHFKSPIKLKAPAGMRLLWGFCASRSVGTKRVNILEETLDFNHYKGPGVATI